MGALGGEDGAGEARLARGQCGSAGIMATKVATRRARSWWRPHGRAGDKVTGQGLTDARSVGR